MKTRVGLKYFVSYCGYNGVLVNHSNAAFKRLVPNRATHNKSLTEYGNNARDYSRK